MLKQILTEGTYRLGQDGNGFQFFLETQVGGCSYREQEKGRKVEHNLQHCISKLNKLHSKGGGADNGKCRGQQQSRLGIGATSLAYVKSFNSYQGRSCF